MANEKKATRAAFGETLVELVEEGKPVVAVEADLSGSTTTKKLGDIPSVFSTWVSPSRIWSASLRASL